MSALLKAIQKKVGAIPDGIYGGETELAIGKALDVEVPTVEIDMTRLFREIKAVTGALSQVQVDSINAIVSRMKQQPIQMMAYVLATAWHEARFKPQREWGRGIGKKYGRKGKYGQPQYGRGLVQLTWDYNYEWADQRLGLDGALLQDFDLALKPDIAADILCIGMIEGAFASNGKPLSHYGPKANGTFDYYHARQTVNRLDKAELIAGHARKFEAAIRRAMA